MSETVYFITGASRGIGLEFIHQLVKREKSVVYAGVRNPASLEKHFPSPRPENLHIVPCDVISDESVQAAASIVSEKSGRVDVLINNAGIDNGLSIRETSVDSFRIVLETNLVGVHRMVRAFLPLISRSSIKKIINISSDFGSVALNDRRFAGAYNTSKAALNMLTVQYKNEYAEEGIIFIPLHPGDVS
jgi:NAD(P)-dependent dehydrogenase (short-subunit alcohol dehydrogenase family)